MGRLRAGLTGYHNQAAANKTCSWRTAFKIGGLIAVNELHRGEYALPLVSIAVSAYAASALATLYVLVVTEFKPIAFESASFTWIIVNTAFVASREHCSSPATGRAENQYRRTPCTLARCTPDRAVKLRSERCSSRGSHGPDSLAQFDRRKTQEDHGLGDARERSGSARQRSSAEPAAVKGRLMAVCCWLPSGLRRSLFAITAAFPLAIKKRRRRSPTYRSLYRLLRQVFVRPRRTLREDGAGA